MNLRLGIYEIFSRIIPGGVYIVVILQFLTVLGLVRFDWRAANDLSLALSIGFVIVAYIIGGAFDRASLVWFRIFKKPGLSTRQFAEFKKKHQARWRFDLGEDDWSILLAYIRTKNLELAGEIDRHNAVSIMLRNVSLGLLLMSVNSLVQWSVTRETTNLVFCALLLLVSILTVLESVKFRGWFYSSVFETALAYRIDLPEVIRPVRVKTRGAKEKE